MAIPPSPSVVVLENDLSIYAPNVDSSVVGIVGFADKGPTNEATLITSQNQLIEVFGRPSSNIPGQGLEGALEILEATNKVYFVRAADASAANASAVLPLGFPPVVELYDGSSTGLDANVASLSLSYTLVNAGVTTTGVVSMVSSTTLNTVRKMVLSYFDKSLTGDNIIYAANDSNGSTFITTRYAGINTSLSVSSSNPAALRVYYMDPTVPDAPGVGIEGESSTIAYGGTGLLTGASSVYAVAQSVYPGTGYNLSSLRDGTIVGASIEVDNISIMDKLTINVNGAQKEVFEVTLSPSSEYSLEYLLNTSELLNQSDVVNVQLLASGSDFAAPDNEADIISINRSFNFSGTTVFGKPRFLKLIEGTYALSGGDSGYSTTETGATTDFTALIGTDAAKSGMYALNDDSLNISLALVPGIPSQTVQNALITLAETSKNFIAVVSPPQGLDSVQDAVNWMNGKETRTAAINNSYAAVYWPWVQTFNYYAGADEWYDPAIFAARQYVFTDSVAEPWFAPAGYRRGRLTKPSNTEVILNQGDRDTLYTNNINPVTKDTQAGIVIFGQRTAQRLPTALNSVNVRRLMIYIRKVLLILGKPFQFQPNDEFTWEQVEDAITPFLDDLKARRGIVEGAVKCDATTNTPLRVDRKELWCSVTIKPTLAAETIVFEVNLTNQSATVNG